MTPEREQKIRAFIQAGYAYSSDLAFALDEFAWRLNEGNVKRHSLDRLASFVDAIVGKRLTYARLIA